MKKILCVMLCAVAFCRCESDDDGGTGPALLDLEDLQDEWIDQSVFTGSSNNGFIVVEFNTTLVNGVVRVASQNDQSFVCDELIFRNIEIANGSSFTGEGKVNLGFGTEWVPITITVNDTDEIAIDYDCESCNPVLDVLQRLESTNTLIPVEISEDIDSELTLVDLICDPDQPDYLVTDLIDVNNVLTVEPGVVIAFDANTGLVINQFSNGVILAQGTVSEPITFTGSTKTKGFWKGIQVETNDVRNELNYVIVEYAGSDEIADDIKGGVKGGVSVNAEPGDFGSLKVLNSTFRENDGYGLVVEWNALLREFANNTFETNTDAAVLMEAPNVGALDAASRYSGGNGYEGVEIVGNSNGNEVVEDATWTGFDDESAYYVSERIEVRADITILPGATFEFEANTFIIFEIDQSGPNDGVIIAEGTAADPITFTGFNKTPGYWSGIIINSNSVLNSMEYCIVEYGGSDPIAGGLAGNIALDKNGAFDAPNLNLFNSTIRNSAGCGVIVESLESIFVEADNNYTSNSDGDICD